MPSSIALSRVISVPLRMSSISLSRLCAMSLTVRGRLCMMLSIGSIRASSIFELSSSMVLPSEWTASRNSMERDFCDIFFRVDSVANRSPVILSCSSKTVPSTRMVVGSLSSGIGNSSGGSVSSLGVSLGIFVSKETCVGVTGLSKIKGGSSCERALFKRSTRLVVSISIATPSSTFRAISFKASRHSMSSPTVSEVISPLPDLKPSRRSSWKCVKFWMLS